MEISSSGKILGATVKGIDLAQPLSDRDCKRIPRALGAYGVLCFPDQRLETQELARFGRGAGHERRPVLIAYIDLHRHGVFKTSLRSKMLLARVERACHATVTFPFPVPLNRRHRA